jgi:hypothetical protein
MGCLWDKGWVVEVGEELMWFYVGLVYLSYTWANAEDKRFDRIDLMR